MVATFGAGCAVIGARPIFTRGGTILSDLHPRQWDRLGQWRGPIGSILGPVIGGVLIGLDLPASQLFLFAAVPPLCAAIACFALSRLPSHKGAGPDAELARNPAIDGVKGKFVFAQINHMAIISPAYPILENSTKPCSG